MNYAEQIGAFEARRKTLADANEAIMAKAAEDGATLDADQATTFDENEADMAEIDKHLDRLRKIEKSAIANAVPPAGGNANDAGASRGGHRIEVKRQEKLEPGIAFARLVKSMGEAKGDLGLALRIATGRYGEDSNTAGTLKGLYDRGKSVLQFQGFESVEKATVGAGSTASGNWAADLVLDEGGAFADFANYLRPATILGKFGQGGVPALRNIPFRTALGISTTGGDGYWVGEGLAKPLTAFNVNKTFLEPLKCANIVVLTEELLRSNSYSAETLVRDEMVNALVQLIDTAFIDPGNSGTSNVKPASITNGADSIAASSGGDADDIRLDIRSLIQKFINANNENAGVALVMRTGDALAASMLVNALGQPEFSDIGISGGNLYGLPVITSQSVPSGVIVAVAPSEIYFADDGGFMVDVSREASLLMTNDANANMNSTSPTGSNSIVSMFQTNSVAFRAERILNWVRRRDTAVAYITGAAWGGAVNT